MNHKREDENQETGTNLALTTQLNLKKRQFFLLIMVSKKKNV